MSDQARTVSTEALAIRENLLRKRAENDALILQDDLLIAREQIRQMQSELDHYRNNKDKADGNAA